jgi:hypothetical protein
VGSLLKNQHPHCPGEDGPRTEHCAGVSELFGGRDGGVQGAAASEPGAAPRLLRAAVEDVLAHGLPGLVPVAGCGAAGVVAWNGSFVLDTLLDAEYGSYGPGSANLTQAHFIIRHPDTPPT